MAAKRTTKTRLAKAAKKSPAKPRVRVVGDRTRLDVDERRAQLIALGIERFGTQPFEEVSIDRIAQAAGISKGLLYHYFPTKRAFFAACVREAAGRLLEVTDLRDDIDPLERLTRSLDAYLGFVRAHAPAFATLMHGLGIDREVTAIVNGTRNTLLGRLTEGFTSFGQRRQLVILPATPRVHIALRGWIGMAEAMSIQWVDELAADPAACPSQADIRDLLAASLVEIVKRLTS